jgi:hypothetical protein
MLAAVDHPSITHRVPLLHPRPAGLNKTAAQTVSTRRGTPAHFQSAGVTMIAIDESSGMCDSTQPGRRQIRPNRNRGPLFPSCRRVRKGQRTESVLASVKQCRTVPERAAQNTPEYGENAHKAAVLSITLRSPSLATADVE